MVYHKNWVSIVPVYRLYMKDIPYSIFDEYSGYITGISETFRYMHGIYQVFTWYISVICRPHQYAWYIPTLQQLGLLRTFFNNYILVIYNVYPWNIHCISQGYNYKKRYGTNPYVVKLVYTRHIGEDCIWLRYTLYITRI